MYDVQMIRSNNWKLIILFEATKHRSARFTATANETATSASICTGMQTGHGSAMSVQMNGALAT